MVALRYLILMVVVALVAVWLQGCSGDCAEEGCKYDYAKVENHGIPLDERKKEVDDYVQCQKDKDCCVPVDTANKMISNAEGLNHGKQAVQDMEKCSR
mmetsp:Transcript_163214/g.297721  ORF Transcript_163214/g.297721 Transcript_163214/m.297721 type:complete len:98 (-) Transcript_163214:70-363(-)